MPTRSTMPALNLRPMDPDAREQIRRAASARGITSPEYVARLAALHAAMIEAALNGDKAARKHLDAADLGPVSR